MQWVKRVWHGKEKLWKVFWIGAFAMVIIELATIWLLSDTESIHKAETSGYGAQSVPYLTKLVAPLIPESILMIVWIISVWKCAVNTEVIFWKYFARIAAALYGVRVAINIALIFGWASVGLHYL